MGTKTIWENFLGFICEAHESSDENLATAKTVSRSRHEELVSNCELVWIAELISFRELVISYFLVYTCRAISFPFGEQFLVGFF